MRKRIFLFLLPSLFLAAALASASYGAPPAFSTKGAKASAGKQVLPSLSAPPKGASEPRAIPLWHEWYVIKREGKVVGIYEEEAEKRTRDSHVAVTQKWVERWASPSEAFIGSVAQAESLVPVAFFVDRKGEKSYKMDGRVRENQLEVAFKPLAPPGEKTAEAVKLKPGVYFGSILPLAIARHLEEKGSFRYIGIVEDDGEMNVTVQPGVVEIPGTSKKIGEESCQQAFVDTGGKKQEWWITAQGKTCLVVTGDSGLRLELSNEKEATSALKPQPR